MTDEPLWTNALTGEQVTKRSIANVARREYARSVGCEASDHIIVRDGETRTFSFRPIETADDLLEQMLVCPAVKREHGGRGNFGLTFGAEAPLRLLTALFGAPEVKPTNQLADYTRQMFDAESFPNKCRAAGAVDEEKIQRVAAFVDSYIHAQQVGNDVQWLYVMTHPQPRSRQTPAV